MTGFWRLPAFRICLVVLCLALLALGPLLAYAPIRVTGIGALLPAQSIVLFLTLIAVSIALCWRYRNNPALPAKVFTFFGSRALTFVSVHLYLLFYSAASVPLCYLSFSFAFPFQDATLAAMDHALGFDWLYWLKLTNDNPAVGKLFVWAYYSFVPQLLLAVSVLAIAGRDRDLWDLIALIAIGSLVCIASSSVFPALAPFGYYNPDPALFANLESMAPKVGSGHLETILALHAGQITELNVHGEHGLISFPSYHSILAYSMAYGMRNVRFFAIPFLIWNAIMLVATVPVGGHYLVDIIAGFVVFLAMVTFLDRVNGRASMWSLLRVRIVETVNGLALARQSFLR